LGPRVTKTNITNCKREKGGGIAEGYGLLIQPGNALWSWDFSKLRRRSVPDYQFSGTISALNSRIKDKQTVEVGGVYSSDNAESVKMGCIITRRSYTFNLAYPPSSFDIYGAHKLP
jgi:hypothetical protein